MRAPDKTENPTSTPNNKGKYDQTAGCTKIKKDVPEYSQWLVGIPIQMHRSHLCSHRSQRRQHQTNE